MGAPAALFIHGLWPCPCCTKVPEHVLALSRQIVCAIVFPLPTPHGATRLLKVQRSSKGCSRSHLLCPVVDEHQFTSRTNISRKRVPQIHTGYFWNCIELLLLSWCGSSIAYIPDYICIFPKVKYSFPEVFINSLYYLHNWMAAFNCD